MMNFNFQSICSGLFVSLVFGAFGGAAGGAISMGCVGAVAGTIDRGMTGFFLGTFILGFLGAMIGFFVGLGSGAIGWLPILLFPRSKLGSYALAVILGLLVGTGVWIYEDGSQRYLGGLDLWNGVLLLICSISGAIASNVYFQKSLYQVNDSIEYSWRSQP